MNRMTTIVAASVIGFAGVIEVAAESDRQGEPRELQVGRTAIHCYLEPCPWNGIALANQVAQPHSMLWAGDALPPIKGSPEDLAYLLAHYADDCTLVSGRYEGGVLEVMGILGPC